MDRLGTELAAPVPASAWSPFRSPDFARMASAQFVSNIGGWMQTVGAQQLMLTLTSSAALVALIQTAAGIPIVLIAIPAGAIGDVVDRRRLLVASQLLMLVAAAALAGLAFAGMVTPPILLAAIAAVGVGQTLTSPTWQTLQPELVPEQDRTQAIALGSVNQNLSRAVGPAIGGTIYAASSAGVLFLINAISFTPVIAALAAWRSPPRATSSAGREPIPAAIRAGARYVFASPALRRILLRAGLFMLFANSIWALLPVVVHRHLGLGSAAYGLLLGCVGVGAVGGAFLLPWARRALPTAVLMAGATQTLALAIAALAYADAVTLVAPALVAAGAAWILCLSSFNSHYQSTLPVWAKARGMSYYLVVFQGGGALGAAAFGVIAQRAGVGTALLVAAAGLSLVAGIGLLLPFRQISTDALLPGADWPEPQLTGEPSDTGPVLVTVEYRPRPGMEQAVIEQLHAGRFARRRTGATNWQLWTASTVPTRVLEQFVVHSWQEHLWQHERVSRRDAERLRTIAKATEGKPLVEHWLAGRPTNRRASGYNATHA